MIRLEDQMGRKITFEDLPLNVDDMVDNPFRSLAWLLKKAKTYKDLDVPFQEFAWASFLRTEFAKHRWPLNFRSDQQYMSAVE
ncbi:ParB/Srx family N-terminal domain-containing protein, partial [Shewanella algae]|uniref:ParB/Srx family N-terminal domain-containing protein n=1 Tax=Shewanella algae TaxID=38313 RepID=UPI00313C8348